MIEITLPKGATAQDYHEVRRVVASCSEVAFGSTEYPVEISAGAIKVDPAGVAVNVVKLLAAICKRWPGASVKGITLADRLDLTVEQREIFKDFIR